MFQEQHFPLPVDVFVDDAVLLSYCIIISWHFRSSLYYIFYPIFNFMFRKENPYNSELFSNMMLLPVFGDNKIMRFRTRFFAPG